MQSRMTQQLSKAAPERRPIHTEHSPNLKTHHLAAQVTATPLFQPKASCACGGGCPRCQEAALLQPQLKISEPGDRDEQEADRIADQVMRMPEPMIQRQMEPGKILQAKGMSGQTPEVTPSLESHIQQRQGLGQSMTKMTRNKMESSFGADFSDVNIHTDNYAVQMNQALNAQAFTIGNNVFFNSGKYTPGSSAGDQLLAHELSHVLQQREGRQPCIQRKDAQEQGCDGKVGDIFELMATIPATPPQYSTALIGKLHQPNLLPKTYFIGDWLNDYMVIVDIPYTERAVVIVMHCETAETLEAGPGQLPQSEHTVKVQNSTFGPGTARTFDSCQQVEFIFEDNSKPPRKYKLETKTQIYWLQDSTHTGYSPLDLEDYLGIHLQGEKCGMPKKVTPPAPPPEDFENP